MVFARTYWIAIWYGILFLGVLGLWSSLYWGRQTRWKNLDELLRAIGTITVSIGMLLLLKRVATVLGQLLLAMALLCFVVAFALGRNAPPRAPSERDRRDDDEDPEPRTGA
jgi:hypothetical protein